MESSSNALRDTNPTMRKRLRRGWETGDAKQAYITVALGWCLCGALAGEGVREPLVGRVSAVVAVVVGPAWRRGGIGLVVIFAERCGIVSGCVDIRLLEWRLVEVGSFIWQQIVLV